MKTVFDRIIIFLTVISLLLCAIALVDFVLHPLARDFTYNSIFFRAISILVLTPLTLLVGFLIIRRVPGNIVGPLLILWAGTVAYGAIRKDIGIYPYAFFAFYDIAIGWFALFMMVLHFPDGQIYPRGAAGWVYTSLGICIALNFLLFFSSSSLQGGATNPFHVHALTNFEEPIARLSILIFFPVMLMTLVSPVLRYRKGSPLERQQIKWLALFGAILITEAILLFIVIPLLTGGKMMQREDNLSSLIFFIIIGLFPPLAIGVAVLRYRLWDIDVIIRRTVVYSILTVILTLIYFGSVIALQELSQAILGEHQSSFATILSTLVIAALFTPLRRGIQNSIDRRFYRNKYTTEKVLAAFSTTLRNEVDLDELKSSILEVVEGTMQPDHISLWLRDTDPWSALQKGEQTAPKERVG
jgi:hypothetical protein